MACHCIFRWLLDILNHLTILYAFGIHLQVTKRINGLLTKLMHIFIHGGMKH